jgi:hypothetical protein
MPKDSVRKRNWLISWRRLAVPCCRRKQRPCFPNTWHLTWIHVRRRIQNSSALPPIPASARVATRRDPRNRDGPRVPNRAPRLNHTRESSYRARTPASPNGATQIQESRNWNSNARRHRTKNRGGVRRQSRLRMDCQCRQSASNPTCRHLALPNEWLSRLAAASPDRVVAVHAVESIPDYPMAKIVAYSG